MASLFLFSHAAFQFRIQTFYFLPILVVTVSLNTAQYLAYVFIYFPTFSFLKLGHVHACSVVSVMSDFLRLYGV